tara:strand:+ start:2124 stop:3275 length:1152 start_codon:yes stop_codon:yes gene_type:complete
MIGIFIGIAAVISLIGLGEGLRSAITNQFGFLGNDILGVQASGIAFSGPPGQGTANPLSDTLVNKIKGISGIETTFNRYIESGTMEFNDRQAIGLAASIPSGENKKIFETMFNLKTEEGRLLKANERNKVLLGFAFSEEDIFGRGISAGDNVFLNEKKYNVVGILEKKGSFIIDSGVFLNEDDMLDLYDNDINVGAIAIKVRDPDNVEEVQIDVERLLRKERGVKKGEENFQVQSPQSIIETLNSTMFAVQLFIYIIAFISLIVGGIGIMNTMYTAVLERTKEIGIMKAIGARNSTIFGLFFIESGFLGMVGGIVGILIGAGFAYGLAFVGKLALGSDLIQAKISLTLIIGSLLFSFVLGTVFGVLPAMQASKLHPVEALRSK